MCPLPITMRLIDFYIFNGQFVSKKNFWKDFTLNLNFRRAVKIGPKQGKTTLIVK